MKYLLASKDSQAAADATVEELKKLKVEGASFSVNKEDLRFKVYAEAKRITQDNLDNMKIKAGEASHKLNRRPVSKKPAVSANTTIGGPGGAPPVVTAK